MTSKMLIVNNNKVIDLYEQTNLQNKRNYVEYDKRKILI